MPSNPVMVLLVGETARSSSNVLEWLERRGSRCQFSRSYGDACELIRSTQFDLVLSEYQLPDRTAFPLLDWLEGSSATLFFSTRVEDGSLWLKMLERGTRCVGAPILRSRDLPKALGTLLAAAVEPSEQARVDSNTATLRPSLTRFWP
jgi:CheY-like chemotaxis protein